MNPAPPKSRSSAKRADRGRQIRAQIRAAKTRAELFPLAANSLADYFGAAAAGIFVPLNDRDAEAAIVTRPGGKYRQLTFPLSGDNVVAKVLATGGVVNLPSATAAHLQNIPGLETYAGGAALTVPLANAGAARGAALVIRRAGRGGFSPDEETLCRAIADDVASRLDFLAQHDALTAEMERLRWEKKQLELVISSAPELSSRLEPEKMLGQVLDVINRGLPYERAAIYLYDEETQASRQIALRGYGAKGAKYAAASFDESQAAAAIRERHSVLTAAADGVGRGRRGESQLAVPILYHNKCLGVIHLTTAGDAKIEKSDVSFVEAMALHAGGVLESRRRLQVEAKRGLQLDLINKIGKKLLPTLSPRELFAEVAGAIRQKFDYYNVSIFAVDEGRKEAVMEANVGGYEGVVALGYRQPLDVGIVGAAAREQASILANDVALDDRFYIIDYETMQTRAELAVPVKSDGRVLAVIDVQSRRRGAFDESDVLALETLGDYVAVAFRNAALLRRERKRADELALINTLGRQIQGARDIAETLRMIAGAIRDHFDNYSVALFLSDSDRPRTLTVRVVEGAYKKLVPPDLSIPFGRGFVGWAAEHGEVALSNDAANDPRFAPDPIPGTARSEVSVPIKAAGRVIGVLDVQDDKTGSFSTSDVELLQTFADQIAIAIQNAYLLDKEHRATQDAKTLLHISHVISQTTDLSKSLEFLVAEMSAVMGANAAALILLDNAGAPTVMKAAVGLPPTAEKDISSGRYNLAQSPLYRKVIESNRPIFIADIAADGRVPQDIFPAFEAGALLITAVHKKDALLGVMLAAWRTPKPAVTSSDVALFEGIAFQAAIGVENLQFLENVTRQTNYLSILSSIAADASRLPPLEELLNVALQKIATFAGLDGGAVHLYDEKHERLNLTTHFSAVGIKERPWGTLGPMTPEQTAALLEADILIKRNEKDADPFMFPPPAEGGPAAYISVPLITKQKLLGRLTLFAQQPREFYAEDTDLLQTICDELSLFIDNARLFSQTSGQMKELLTLMDTTKTLASSLDTEEIIQNIARKVKDLIGADECTIFLLNRAAGVLEPIVSLTAYPEEVMKMQLKVGEGFTGHVAQTGVGEYVNDALADARSVTVPGTPSEEKESLLCVPLLSREEVIGVMTLGRLGGGIFTDRDLNLLTLFAGQVAGSIENARLLDDLRSSMSTAEEHQRKLNAIFTSISDAIIVTDTALQVIEVNPAAEKMLGRTAAELVNRHVRSIIDTPTLHNIFEAARARLEHEAEAEFEFAAAATGERKRTTYYRVLVDAVMGPKREKVGYVATFHDVTEAKELASLKENFIANVGHELRTPLASIIGSTDIIKGDHAARSHPSFRFIDIIDKEACRLRELVESILDFSRLEMGERELHLEAVDINLITAEAIENYRQEAEDKSVSLELALGPGVPTTQADRRLINTIVGNLVKNGIQFNRPGGYVRVSTAAHNNNIVITVADNGPGIPQDQLENVFSSFYQIDGSSTRAVGGTGLGLAVVKRAVEAHGGHIEISSAAGEGATFTVYLPIREEPAEEDD